MFDQALAPEKVRAITEALMDSDGNVRGGSSMFNSGELFTSLYDHPWFREIGAHVVGGDSHHAQIFVAQGDGHFIELNVQPWHEHELGAGLDLHSPTCSCTQNSWSFSPFT